MTAAVCFVRGSRTGEEEVATSAKPHSVRVPATAAPIRATKPSVASKPRPKPILSIDDDERTPEERALEERIEKSLDDEDFDAALACVDEALKCEVAEIRQNMVDTLGWFGEKALPELTPFLADVDEDIRDSAMSEWTMALSSIEDEGGRIRIVELAMGVLKDEDVLEEIISTSFELADVKAVLLEYVSKK